MTALAWDQVGERRYETGVDRGVLYLPDGSAVVWNGLTSISEETNQETKSYYLDGVKYLEYRTPNDFKGKIQAFTYPDELEELIGLAEFSPGVFVHDQPEKPFNLAYRTLIGNDVDGLDHGYKLHILYNVLASPSGRQFPSVNASSAPMVFEWDISAVPPIVMGIRPTAHVSFNSRLMDPELLQFIENTLYGTAVAEPSLPAMIDLFDLIAGYILTIIDNGDGTWTASGLEVTLTGGGGFDITDVDVTYLDEDTFQVDEQP